MVARFLLGILVIAAGIPFGCSTHSPEKRFWTWFQGHEEMLYDFEKNQQTAFDQLTSEMHNVDPALTFEFGPKQNGRRELVISADGIRKAFPKVESLYATAPSLPRWKFIKYRQRAAPLDLAYEGIAVKADAVAVQLQRDGAKTNLTVYIPGYSAADEQKYQSIAFLLLDRALGEYDVETRVGAVRVASTAQAPAQAYSLDSLPKAFDRLLAGAGNNK